MSSGRMDILTILRFVKWTLCEKRLCGLAGVVCIAE